MANGLLGKKLVGSRDTEVVYTVPSAKVATFNVNVLNDGAVAANVNVYISDKTYQTGDFVNYDATPSDASVVYTTADAGNTLDLIGHRTEVLVTDMKTTPVEPASANTASTPIAAKEILAYQTKQTVGGVDYHYMVQDTTRLGNPIWFHSGTELILRSPDNGSTYDIDNYVNDSGSAANSASNYGMTAGDNILWATNVDGPFAMAYVQGVPGSSGSLVNTIADWRAAAATYNTAFTWGLGAITKIAGVKTNEERFIVGTSTGFNYISNDDTPEAQAEFTSNSMSPPTGVSGHMIGAAAIATDATDGKIYIAYSGGKVAYADYTTASPLPTTGYTVFDFPSGVTNAMVVDVRAEGTNFVLVVSGGQKYSTSNLGVSWTQSKHYAKQPIGIKVASIDNQNRFIEGAVTGAVAELTFVRGHTYRIYQMDTSNNGHPLNFSTTANGTHAGGTAYTDGMIWQMGSPSSTSDYTLVTSTVADWNTNHVTYNGQARVIEWTVPSNAPDTLYTYCSNHSGMGQAVSIVDEPSTAPHDDQTLLVTNTIWTDTNGDANRKYDLFFNGEDYMREKRFFELPQGDKFDKAEIASNEILERTGIMASAGEQLVVTTDQDNIIVRVYGIEE
jgi:YD repeat-containing protein